MSDYESRKILAENLRELIKRNGITMKDLAIALNVPYTTVCDWCKAKTYPRRDKIVLLAQYFGVTNIEITEDHNLSCYVTGPGEYYDAATTERPELETLFLLGDVANDEELHKIVEIAKTILGEKAEKIKRI